MTDKTRLRKVLQRAKNDKVFFAENFLETRHSLKYYSVVDVQENHYYFK